MRAVSRGLYQALRGGGAVIEGAEFLLTHHDIAGRQIRHFLASAACALIAMWVASQLKAALPAAPVIALPWYLVLVEWFWSSLPALLAAQVAAWSAEMVYLAFASPRQLVLAVISQRGAQLPLPITGNERGQSLIWLTAGAVGCGGLALVPVAGPALAAVLACPVLGAGLVVATLTQRGWPPRTVCSFVRSHGSMLTGLGLGVAVGLAIPVVNLAALPCAAVGTTCLLLREPQPERAKTSEGTVPCASPDR